MAQTWPASLPQAPLRAGFRYTPTDQSISTTMDTGPRKRRRRFSTAFGIYEMSFYFTGAQRATFLTFWQTTIAGGSDSITFPDPVTTVSGTFLMVGAPSYEFLATGATAAERDCIVSMTWERVT